MFETVIHATAIGVDGHAVLIMGDSGVGKSALALRFILDRHAVLIADDMTVLKQDNAGLTAVAAAMQGALEVRGIGILTHQVCLRSAPVAVVLTLTQNQTERMPLTQRYRTFLGVDVPEFELNAQSLNLDIQAYVAVQVALGKMRLFEYQKEDI